MRKFALLLAVAALAGPAQAQDEWARARTVEVRLSSFDFTPHDIVLPAGQPIVLHLVNSGSGGHNFAAPDFFRTARVRGNRPANGTIEVPSRQSVDIALVPAAGTYRLRCTHAFHTALGMRGRIVVR